MRRRRWPALIPFLVLAAATAALGLRVQDRLAAPPPPLAANTGPLAEQDIQAALPPAPARPRLVAPPPGRFDVVVARNLFARDRRPPPRPEAEAPARNPARAALEARLTGVVLGGQAPQAMVFDEKEESLARLSVGDRLHGWRLIAVDANSATFQAGGQSQTLSLAFASAAPEGEGPRRANAESRSTQSAARPDAPETRSLRAIRRGHMGGLDRDPDRSLLNSQGEDRQRPRRANRVPDIPQASDFE